MGSTTVLQRHGPGKLYYKSRKPFAAGFQPQCTYSSQIWTHCRVGPLTRAGRHVRLIHRVNKIRQRPTRRRPRDRGPTLQNQKAKDIASAFSRRFVEFGCGHAALQDGMPLLGVRDAEKGRLTIGPQLDKLPHKSL